GFLFAASVSAQDEKAPRTKPRNLVREGYTRPGKPDDRKKGGILVSPALNPDYKGPVMGGTIYFAVFERTGAEGDTWGTGIEDFDIKFVEGRSHKDTFSPVLDTKARYLYLYQVVNDRGLYQWDGATFAALRDQVRNEDVGSTWIRLLVDPRYITSWGHFQAGFTFRVPDRMRTGEAVAAADGGPGETVRLAASSN